MTHTNSLRSLALYLALTLITVPAFAGSLSQDRTPPPSDISVEVLINGVDGSTAPGPSVPAGETLNWTYLVTNTGNAVLTSVTVSDSQGIGVTCWADETLTPGESMTCIAVGVAQPGPQRNRAIVTGVTPEGATVSDTDPCYYVGETD